VASITPKNGRVNFVAAHDPDIYWELNSTNLGTNYGDDPTGNDDNNNVSGNISTSDSYEGLDAAAAPQSGSHLDDDLINDAACLLYIPAGLAHGTVRGIFHNGGGTNGQGLMIRATTTGVEIACGHNNGNAASQDNVIEEIPDADLPGWFCISCQFNSHGGTEGDMALWLNGTAVRSGTRTYTLDWGSGNPELGDANHAEPDEAACLDPSSYSGGDWGSDNTINGTGILIANFTTDNPSGGASDTSAGNGNTWHTDYYDEHVDAGADLVVDDFPTPEELSITGNAPKRGAGLRLNGLVPTLQEGVAGEDVTEEPDAGSVSLTGETPTAQTTAHHWIDVDAGSLSLTGETPAILVSKIVAPDIDSLVLTGVLPTLDQTAHHIRAPPLGALTLTGATPNTITGNLTAPSAGSLSLTGYAPSAAVSDNHTAEPDTGSLTLTGYLETSFGGPGFRLIGYEPTISIEAASFEVEPDSGSLALTGYAPSLSYSWTVSPDTGTVALTGYAPTLDLTENIIEEPSVWGISLT